MKMTTRDRILLGAIGLLAAVGGLWWFYVKPARSDANHIRGEAAAARDEVGTLRDTLARYTRDKHSLAADTAERLRLSKALPDSPQVPATLVQLQRLADRADVEFSSIATTSTTDYGGVRADTFTVKVAGKFFDVDDFMYRLHALVRLDGRDRPVVHGRLYAVSGVEVDLKNDDNPATQTTGTAKAKTPADDVTASVTVVAFSRSATPPAAPSTGTTPTTVNPHVGTASTAGSTASTEGGAR